MTPNAAVVRQLLVDCLFRQGEPLEPFVGADGLATRFRFHPERLRERRGAIAEQLRGLPEPFHAGGGGGYSYLGANRTREGELWGEHQDVERLICLGMAAGFANYCVERKFWTALPGWMPSSRRGLKGAGANGGRVKIQILELASGGDYNQLQ